MHLPLSFAKQTPCGPPATLVQHFILRNLELVTLVTELRHVLNSTSETIKDYQGIALDMPIIDFEAMLEFIISDLHNVMIGEISASALVRRYILEEVLERDAEYTALLHGVKTLTENIIKTTSRIMLDYPLDHHAPHQYQLQQVLPSGGLMLERTCHPYQGH